MVDEAEFDEKVAPFRSELKAHCYRMSGSLHDAEDLLQDSLLRAWKGWAAFEGRSTLRTWLYQIATNTCLTALESRKPRALPIDAGSLGDANEPMVPDTSPRWLEPCPSDLYEGVAESPDARYGAKESVALAFLAALQLLPARQRALLILHDVLGWKAAECAKLLELTEAAVNSALQRARETLGKRSAGWSATATPEFETQVLLARYVRAWEQADLSALVSLLHEDATLAMPPYPLWLRGAAALERSMKVMVFEGVGAGHYRTLATRANGQGALAVYRLDPATREHVPFALHLLEWRAGRLAALTAFLDTSLFAPLGLPARLERQVQPSHPVSAA